MALNNLLNTILLIQGIFLLFAGAFLHYSPQTVVGAFNSEKISKDTIADLKGWGSTILALAAVTFQGYNLNSEPGKKVIFRSLFIGWAMTAYGTSKMLTSGTTHWDGGLIYILFFIEVVMAGLNLLGGVYYTEDTNKSKSH